MSRSDTDVVIELINASNDQNYQRLTELLAENYVARTYTGQIYVGSTGFSNWMRDLVASISDRHFETHSVRQPAPEFVLVHGTDRRTLATGDSEVIPGHWLYHVRDGRVNAVVYFRTEREALEALTGPGRGELPVQTVERVLHAFNRDDFVELVSSISAELEFDSLIDETQEVHRGLQGVLRRILAMKDAYEMVAVEIRDLADLGAGFVVVEGTLLTEAAGEIESRPMTYLARVEDGKLAEFFSHPDRRSAERAVYDRVHISEGGHSDE